MKAIQLTGYGNPAQNLKLVELPEPNAPSAGEALVRMEYAPIAYSDLLLANGVYLLKPKLPSVIGGEGGGIVEAIGPGVTSVRIGDRVTIPFWTFTWSAKVLAEQQRLDPAWEASRLSCGASNAARAADRRSQSSANITPRRLVETHCNGDLPDGSCAVEPPPLEKHQTMITSRRSRIPGTVEPRLFKLKDACAYLGGLSPNTVRRLIARGFAYA